MAARWRSAGSPAVLEVVVEAVHGFIAFPITVTQQELARGFAYVSVCVRNKAYDAQPTLDCRGLARTTGEPRHRASGLVVAPGLDLFDRTATA